jgi:hypothetical protein
MGETVDLEAAGVLTEETQVVGDAVGETGVESELDLDDPVPVLLCPLRHGRELGTRAGGGRFAHGVHSGPPRAVDAYAFAPDVRS